MILAAILMGQNADSIRIQSSSTKFTVKHLEIKLPSCNVGAFHSTRNYKIFETGAKFIGTEI